MVVFGVTRAPQFVQIARQTAGSTHHDGTVVAELIDGADDFALAWQGRQTDVVDALHFGVPFGLEPAGFGAVARIDLVARQGCQ